MCADENSVLDGKTRGFVNRVCARCKKSKGTYSYRYDRDGVQTRDYFHPDCFKKMLKSLKS